jgi:hypothetical protein
MLSALVAPVVGAAVARADAIYIKPGQCILVGAQQVCALAADVPGAPSHTTSVLHLCQYGIHPGAEVANLKTYAVMQVMMRDDGAKVETPLKHYGMNDADKAACEKEADRLNAEGKK